MPSGKNWINFVYVNLAFIIYILIIFYYSQVANIKANWPLYRCNPLYMPLSDNIEQNFVYCIQSIQTNFMGYLLQPLTFVTSSLGSMFGNFAEEINNIRAMFNKIRTFFSDIVKSIFGVFLNLVIEFQRITISIKDLIGKTIGIMVSLMYVMDGSIKTMNSTWNGPPGQLVRSLGKCFYPYTKIELKNREIKCIKDIKLGDILKNGSIVEAIMQIDNKREPELLYEIHGGINEEIIFVTGTHLVFDTKKNKFVSVKDYPNAKLSCCKTNVLCCLITNDHKIVIGNKIFWDWEDYIIKYLQEV